MDLAGRTRRLLARPALAILLLAPFLGETLSTATPPLDLLLPWNLALMAGLYGCGALVCREVARRFGLGLLGLVLLGAAYGVFEEALVDRYWFYPTFWDDSGVGTYSVVWHTNLILATHLTVFHAAVSICSSVLIVERLFPSHRERAWCGRGGLAMALFVLVIVVPFLYGEFTRGPGPAVLIAAGVLCGLLVVAALASGRAERAAWAGSAGPAGPAGPLPAADRPRRRGLGLIASACTAAHFVLTYAIPSTGVPWPLGVAISLAPVVVGVVWIRHLATSGPYGPDGLRVITGILGFFVVLDFLVGLGGRYDLTVGAVATAFALRWLHVRERRASTPPPLGG